MFKGPSNYPLPLDAQPSFGPALKLNECFRSMTTVYCTYTFYYVLVNGQQPNIICLATQKVKMLLHLYWSGPATPVKHESGGLTALDPSFTAYIK